MHLLIGEIVTNVTTEMVTTMINKPEFQPHRYLQLLTKIAVALNQDQSLDKTLDNSLAQLDAYMSLEHCSITLLNRENNQISIEKAHGLSAQAKVRGKYQLGEGITGTVVKTGQTVIVPNIWEEPKFLGKTHDRTRKEPVSFICVPIIYRHEVIGTLSAEQVFQPHIYLEEHAEILTIIAFMISEAVSILRLEQEKEHEDNIRLKEENDKLKEALRMKDLATDMVGTSSVMQQMMTLVGKAAKSNVTVFILGESGVGKELVANAIHYNSDRKDKPFIKFNCAALAESVIESELFGHERGAFTGAVTTRKGRFEIADGGTIFLDEIGEISPVVQTKLLRVIQEKEVERLGSATPIKINVRIVAATNKNLEALMAAGKFREDLYYRLNVFPIMVPPLRERKTDIPLLTDYFIERYAREMNVTVKRISTPAIDMLMSYHWPGNVRELQNCMERAVLLTQDGVIRGYHLPPTLQSSVASGTVYQGTLEEAVSSLEKEIIVDALKETHGNMSLASQKLGLTERVMGLRLKKYNINYKNFRQVGEKSRENEKG